MGQFELDGGAKLQSFAAAPIISPETQQLLEEANRSLGLSNWLLTAVGAVAAVVGLLLAILAIVGVAAAKTYIDHRAEIVAERVHSNPIARALNSVALIEWERVKGTGPSKERVISLAESALGELKKAESPDLDLLAAIKANLAYYYVDFDRKDKWHEAVKYSQEALDRFPLVEGAEKRRRAVQWLETFAFVHSRVLSCDDIRTTRLRETIRQWMEWHELIRDDLLGHLAEIEKRCPALNKTEHRG